MVQPRADGREAGAGGDDALAGRGRRRRRDRLGQRPCVLDAARRHRGGAGDRAGARRAGGDRPRERHEGAVRPPARRVRRDRGRDLRPGDPRRLGARVGEPRRRRTRTSRRSCRGCSGPAATAPTDGSCRPRSGSAGSTRRWSSAQSADKRRAYRSRATPRPRRILHGRRRTAPSPASDPRPSSSSPTSPPNNDRAWFQPRKAEYERLLKEPIEALCVALEEQFRARDMPLRADPARSPFRIYRDVRFSKDKSPYKTHVGGELRAGPATA